MAVTFKEATKFESLGFCTKTWNVLLCKMVSKVNEVLGKVKNGLNLERNPLAYLNCAAPLENSFCPGSPNNEIPCVIVAPKFDGDCAVKVRAKRTL